jgi:hypothetical protein
MTRSVEDCLKGWLSNVKAKNAEAAARRYGDMADQLPPGLAALLVGIGIAP